ncbi:hypothetical protein ACLOJK_021431 [Asimina triloba]
MGVNNQNLIKFSYPTPFSSNLIFSDVFQDHVNIDIKASESTNELLITLHNYPYLRSYTSIYQLRTEELGRIVRHFSVRLKKRKNVLSFTCFFSLNLGATFLRFSLLNSHGSGRYRIVKHVENEKEIYIVEGCSMGLSSRVSIWHCPARQTSTASSEPTFDSDAQAGTIL